MKKFYKKFTAKYDMVKTLVTLSSEFNTEATLAKLKTCSKRRTYLVHNEGRVIACDNFKKFIMILAKTGKIDGLMYPICFGRGEVYHIYSKVDYFSDEAEQSLEADITPLEAINLDNPNGLCGGYYNPVIGTPVIEVEESTLSGVDWEWVNSLENCKKSKVSLDEYAKKFDVNLKGNRSLKNMIKDFQSAMSI